MFYHINYIIRVKYVFTTELSTTYGGIPANWPSMGNGWRSACCFAYRFKVSFFLLTCLPLLHFASLRAVDLAAVPLRCTIFQLLHSASLRRWLGWGFGLRPSLRSGRVGLR